jgi:hypothetical protein
MEPARNVVVLSAVRTADSNYGGGQGIAAVFEAVS